MNPSNAELNRSVVNVDTIQQKNTCQESFMLQNDETSSIANSRPPTGAPNAEATPAAAPAEMKLRLEEESNDLLSIQWYNLIPHDGIILSL